jgi:hypothetical protein
VWRGLFQSLPSCPWKVSIAVQYSVPQTNNVVINGLYLYNGTRLDGFETEYSTGGFQQRLERITNVTTDGSTPWFSATGFVMRSDYNQLYYEQIRDDCTNYYFDSSVNGVFWYNLTSEAVGAWLTATEIGFGGSQSQGAASPGIATLSSWQVSPDANLNGP